MPQSQKNSSANAAEKALVESAKSGDQRAFEILADNYRRVLDWYIRCFGMPESMYDDLFQEGLTGLLKAVRSYDGQSSSFATFASHCVRNSIISAVRKYNKQTCKNVTMPEKSDKEPTVPSAEEELLDGERVKILYDKVYSILSPYEKTVFDMYLEDFSNENIAVVTGKNAKSTANAIYRIKQKLKKTVGTKDAVRKTDKTPLQGK